MCVLLSNKNGDSARPIGQNDAGNSSENKLSANKGNGLEKTFQFNGSNIYLEDVLFALKNQNWTEEEKPCLDQTVLWLRALQNFTLWAVWDWDAISSEPQGLLFGSRFHLGNFDECMNAPWHNDRPELRTQYCLADITLHRTDNPIKKRISDPYDPYQSALNVIEHESIFRRPLNQLTWGVCVPAVCHRNSVVRLMGILLAHSHLGTAGLKANVAVPDQCQKAGEDREYDIQFYAFMVLFSFLAAITLVCTFLNRKGSYLIPTGEYRGQTTRHETFVYKDM
ncbi:nose resistant to fluoxetine protein 6-like [Leptidea sinapis]|uniref:nose resistant to fluoxetine protein 6-like n=1 Tax=Leptidea sinapis TaxID=189913 RepID=UPI0021C34E99|nr:nose resistant to fluoxetine protein 6-like [Leptidea sinapis]